MQNCEAMQYDLEESVVENASFYDSAIQNISFRRAKVIKSQFQNCNAYGAKFDNSLVAQTNFVEDKDRPFELSRADFTRSMLIDVSLKNANLFGTNFSDAILIRCDLRGVNVIMSDFRGAALIDCKYGLHDLDDAMR
jgi:uncharacterized protein YjbI with pentapeptide repeats